MRSVCAMTLLLALSACKPVGETATVHAVHGGENAVLAHTAWTTVPIALSKDSVHLLARAAETSDRTIIDRLVAESKVIEVPVNTRVRVAGESFNERRVEVLEGVHAGRSGWIPYEWLKPPAK